MNTYSNKHERMLRQLAGEVDRRYKSIYETPNQLNINDHIFISDHSEKPSLAETLVFEQEDTLHISIRFSPAVLSYFKSNPCPSEKLTQNNLGLFAIISEEISHFQCIVHAAETGSSVSRFDLELQSEFDKFLIAADILNHQVGHAHPLHLARLLFDSTYPYHEADLYERASSVAAHWWWNQLNTHGDRLFGTKTNVIQSLKKLRHIHGDAKLINLESLSPKATKRSA